MPKTRAQRAAIQTSIDRAAWQASTDYDQLAYLMDLKRSGVVCAKHSPMSLLPLTLVTIDSERTYCADCGARLSE